ncbi:MAG: hypothetical protein M1825_005953 [Sarcosagium campestre]|nr:MAG: hypothetical protein M1825_005953 [Sarcosagium campestre]
MLRMFRYRKDKRCKHQEAQEAAALQETLSPHAPGQPTNTTHGDDERPHPHPGDVVQESSLSVADPNKCDACETQKRARVYRLKLIVGLFFPELVASLDLTIIATALPFIASHFDQLNQLNWIVTAFTLTSAAFIPVFGQLADVFGRHSMLQASMFFMLLGSALGAGATNFTMLLFGRALQGISTAGVTVLSKIVLADKVTLKENAKNNTWLAIVAGASYAVGPVIGGYLTKASWRWCFIINIPCCIFASGAIYVLLRKELIGPSSSSHDNALKSFLSKCAIIDLGALSLFLISVTLIILATSWGGATYPWSSTAVIAPLTIGALLFLAFCVYEFYMEPGRFLSRKFPKQEPMIPVSLFYKKDMGLLTYINMATGAAMYSVWYFIGIYFTLVESYNAEEAGKQLLYYLPGIGVGVYLGLYFASSWPRDTFLALALGSTVEVIGVGILVPALRSGRVPLIAAMMALAGLGTGIRLMPEGLHVTGIWPSRIAPAMSVTDFALDFGGTLALALMGSVFNNKLASALPGMAGARIERTDSSSLDSIARLPPEVQTDFRKSARNAVVWAFIAILPILAVAALVSFLLGNVMITSREERTESGHLDSKSDVVKGVYLWELVKGGGRIRKQESSNLNSSPADEEEAKPNEAAR